MGIGFIGAGKVATAFGRHLHAHGITISGYFDRHEEKVSHASQATRSAAWKSAAEAADGCDILLITTRDDQIADVCRSLCEAQRIRSNHLVGHMSGAHASLILSDAALAGAAIFSLHPLQAFADEERALANLPQTYFSIEGDDQRLSAVAALLEQSNNPYFRIDPAHKPLYHLAACVLSNYVVTLMASGMAALAKSGINPHDGFRAMRPLIEGTLTNIAEKGPERSLTGPIARGDAGTISTHLSALDEHQMDQLKEDYIFLGLKTLELATRSVLKDPKKAAAVKKVLESQHSG